MTHKRVSDVEVLAFEVRPLAKGDQVGDINAGLTVVAIGNT